MNAVDGARQCTARSRRSGDRCRRTAIKGGTICISHGGGAPQTRAKAQERLLSLVEPALHALERALRSHDLPSALKAARDVLDRAGLQAKQSVELTGPAGGPILAIERIIVDPNDWQGWLTDDQARQLAEWRREATARKADGLPPFVTGGVLDVLQH